MKNNLNKIWARKFELEEHYLQSICMQFSLHCARNCLFDWSKMTILISWKCSLGNFDQLTKVDYSDLRRWHWQAERRPSSRRTRKLGPRPTHGDQSCPLHASSSAPLLPWPPHPSSCRLPYDLRSCISHARSQEERGEERVDRRWWPCWNTIELAKKRDWGYL